MNIYSSDRPEKNYLAAFFGQRTCAGFFAFGVNGAGGEVSKRRRVSSARFSASALTGGMSSACRVARLLMVGA